MMMGKENSNGSDSKQSQLPKGLKPKAKPRGRPFPKGKLTSPAPFRKKNAAGKNDPRINLGGRPKIVGTSYTAILQSAYPMHMLTNEQLERVYQYTGDTTTAITYAEAIALSVITIAALGDVNAAREVRQATEGDKITFATWQTEIIDALKNKIITPEAVVMQLGLEIAAPLLASAGIPLPTSADAPLQIVDSEIVESLEPHE